jgi:hypothetical protein
MASKVQFHTTEKLGPKQSLTPEGFLLCLDVPLARTGMMIYGPNETPISAGKDGLVRIFRDDKEVFNDITLASANGKPVVNEHPDEDVTPENWKELARGICLNPRRGEGAYDDLMIGDLLITLPEEIKAVQEGLREISLGYEADYTEDEPGTGHQSNIIINHIALVESGRCGPRCAIGDQNTQTNKEPIMAKKQTNKLVDALMRAFKAKDSQEVEEIAKEVADAEVEGSGEGDTHIHIHNGEVAAPAAALDEDPLVDPTNDDDYDARFAAIEARLDALEAARTGDAEGEAEEEKVMDELEEEAPANVTKDSVRKAKDSAFLEDSFQETVSMAEIIAPGIRVPTFDRAMKPAHSLKAICNLRSTSLDLAYAQAATRGMIDDLLAGKTLDTKNMTCDAVRTLFRSVGALKKAANNNGSFSVSDMEKTQTRGVKSIAELNKANAEYYAKQH